MKYLKIFILVTVTVLAGCTKNEITPPPTADDYNLVNTVPILRTTMDNLEGIYLLSDGSSDLGSEFVCKVSKSRVSFFSNKEGIFCILKYGLNTTDSSIQFSGFWRYSENTTQGLIHFSISAAEGSTDLMGGLINNLSLQGDFDGNPIKLHYDRAFSAFTKANEFLIFSHHGMQTYTNPPYAENSINTVLYNEGYGVNGLEIDVRMTKDHVPICIHDAIVNTRLTKKGPLSGKWDQYGFAFISQFIRLHDDQKVPSVEEMLTTFIDSTTLKYFWMDIKGNPDIFLYLEPIVRNAYARAATQGRDVEIFAGLPSEDVITEYNEQPTYKAGNPAYSYSASLPTLCELSIDKAIETGSKFYGPRFTQGLLLDDVDKAHNNGVKVISWTLNGKNLIHLYLQDGKFDGFITDYPAYVVYDYYTMF